MARRTLLVQRTLVLLGVQVIALALAGCGGDAIRFEVREVDSGHGANNLFLRIDTSTAGSLGFKMEEAYEKGNVHRLDKHGNLVIDLNTYARTCRVHLLSVPLEYDPPYYRSVDMAIWNNVSLTKNATGVWYTDPLNRYQLRLSRPR